MKVKHRLKAKGWVSLVVLGAVLGGFSFVRCSAENPHVKSGREMLSIGELTDAIKEFKIALENNPKDTKAKALLFYAQMRKDKNINDFSALLSVYMCTEGAKDRFVDKDALDKLKIEIRNALYKAGVETADWKELARIAAFAGKEAFAQPNPEKKEYLLISFKMVGAAIAAKEGNPEGIRYLLKVMKDYEEDNIYLYLFAYEALASIGKPALKTLKTEAASKESLLSEVAERSLTLLDAVDELVAFKQRMPTARSVREDEVEKTIYDDYFGSVATVIPSSGAYYFGDYSLKVELPHVSSLDSEDSLKPKMMLYIYGIDPKRSSEKYFAAFYRWDENSKSWTPVKLQDAKGKTMDMYWAKDPVVEFEESGDGFELSTATVEAKTLYKTEWDWNTYSTRRVPYTKKVVNLETVDLVYANGMLTVKAEEPKKGT